MAVVSVQSIVQILVDHNQTVTLPSPVTAGNTVIACGRHSYTGCPPSLINSNGSTVTTRISSDTYYGPDRVYSMPVTSTGTFTITAKMACGHFRFLFVEEVSGAHATTPIDTTNYQLTSTNNTTTFSLGPVDVVEGAGVRAYIEQDGTETSGWDSPVGHADYNYALIQGKQATETGAVSCDIGMSNGSALERVGLLFSIIPAAGGAPTPDMFRASWVWFQ